MRSLPDLTIRSDGVSIGPVRSMDAMTDPDATESAARAPICPHYGPSIRILNDAVAHISLAVRAADRLPNKAG